MNLVNRLVMLNDAIHIRNQALEFVCHRIIHDYDWGISLLADPLAVVCREHSDNYEDLLEPVLHLYVKGHEVAVITIKKSGHHYINVRNLAKIPPLQEHDDFAIGEHIKACINWEY